MLQEELSIAGRVVESKLCTQNQPSADDETLSIVENSHWFHVPSNQKKKSEIVKEISTVYSNNNKLF